MKINEIAVGKCSICGGTVTLPKFYMSINQPVPTCNKCGARAKEDTNLPVIPMEQPVLKKLKDTTSDLFN